MRFILALLTFELHGWPIVPTTIIFYLGIWTFIMSLLKLLY